MPLKLLLHGCKGKMGQAISFSCEKDPEMTVVCGVDINLSPTASFSYPIYSNLDECVEPFDVLIDFSHPSAFYALIQYLSRKEKPAVIATTGLSDLQINDLTELSSHIPVFYSANMSLGINTLIALTLKASDILGPSFDVEILEAHHHAKIDAPSGTALKIADALNRHHNQTYHYVFDRHHIRAERNHDEIGIHSIRGGSIVGDHTVYFAGKEEVIEITHRAQSRNVFAEGAIAAAKFLYDKKPGWYSMQDMIG